MMQDAEKVRRVALVLVVGASLAMPAAWGEAVNVEPAAAVPQASEAKASPGAATLRPKRAQSRRELRQLRRYTAMERQRAARKAQQESAQPADTDGAATSASLPVKAASSDLDEAFQEGKK